MTSVAVDVPNQPMPNMGEAVDQDRGQMAAMVAAQNDCLCMLSEVGQWWVDRLAEEANATAELTNGLAAAWSLPDVSAAYQHWLERREAMLAADSRELAALAENCAELGSRFVCPDWMRVRA
jgi:hypothetical protein